MSNRPNSVIAVTDREGNANLPEIATAVSKGGTAAYLSSNQNAFTTRTAGFIIQQHFPPGVNNPAAVRYIMLLGVELNEITLPDFLNLLMSETKRFERPTLTSGPVVCYAAARDIDTVRFFWRMIM